MNPNKFESARSASEIISNSGERRPIICTDKWKSEQRVHVCRGPRRCFLFIRRILQQSQTSDSSGEKDEKMSGDGRRRGVAARGGGSCWWRSAAAHTSRDVDIRSELLARARPLTSDCPFFLGLRLLFLFALVLLKVILPD